MAQTQFIRNKKTGGNYKGLYSEYGISLVKGAYDELMAYPPMKDYITNTSRLENGVQYLANDKKYCKYNEKSFSLKFVLWSEVDGGHYNKLKSFIDLISQGMFELKITTLNSVFRLVYKSCSRLNLYKNNYATFELKLVEPDPTDRDDSD